MEQLGRELQLAPEEPRLDEGDLVILQLRADGGAQPHLLPRAREVRRVEQIEVRLAQFHEADQRLDGGEARAQRHIARVLLRHLHREIAAVGHIRRLGLDLHLFKEIQPLQPRLAALHLHHVEDFARRHRQFPPDDAVLGLDVSFDLDLLDVGLVAFFDEVGQIHRARLDIGVLARADPRVDVALRPVEILHRLRVLRQSLGGERLAHAHLQLARHVIRGEELHALEIHRAHLVLPALGDDEVQRHLVPPHGLLPDLLQVKINVARVAIKLRQHIPVIL